MRKTIIAGNWKMNTDRSSSITLADAIVRGVAALPVVENLDIVLCPPSVLVPIVGERIAGTRIGLGAQNMYNEPKGAFTGEVSGEMLRSVGCAYVILGHSERRTMFGESDLDVCYKVNAAEGAGLSPIICVGETAAEREHGMMQHVVERQVRTALDGILEFAIRRCVIAYEPIWAIGTGENATPAQIEEAHTFIRSILADLYDASVAQDVSVLYGGSVNADNAPSIMELADVDGGLIGGASLDADAFVSIIRAAMP
jgi:triosephosphate isomerase